MNAGEKDMEVRRKLAPALERAGYVRHPNPKRSDGRWYMKKVGGVTLYRKVCADILPEEKIWKLLQETESVSRWVE